MEEKLNENQFGIRIMKCESEGPQNENINSTIENEAKKGGLREWVRKLLRSYDNSVLLVMCLEYFS